MGNWFWTLQLIKNWKLWYSESAQMWRLKAMRLYFHSPQSFLSVIFSTHYLSMDSLRSMTIFLLPQKLGRTVKKRKVMEHTRGRSELVVKFRRKTGLEKNDKFMRLLICILTVPYLLVWTVLLCAFQKVRRLIDSGCCTKKNQPSYLWCLCVTCICWIEMSFVNQEAEKGWTMSVWAQKFVEDALLRWDVHI